MTKVRILFIPIYDLILIDITFLKKILLKYAEKLSSDNVGMSF